MTYFWLYIMFVKVFDKVQTISSATVFAECSLFWPQSFNHTWWDIWDHSSLLPLVRWRRTEKRPQCTSPSHSLIWAVYECHPFLLEWSNTARHWGNTGMRTQQLADGIASTHTVWVIALTHNSKGVNCSKLTNWGAVGEVKTKTTQYVSSHQKI